MTIQSLAKELSWVSLLFPLHLLTPTVVGKVNRNNENTGLKLDFMAWPPIKAAVGLAGIFESNMGVMFEDVEGTLISLEISSL